MIDVGPIISAIQDAESRKLAIEAMEVMAAKAARKRLRNEIAMHAMVAFVTIKPAHIFYNDVAIATKAYAMADAMLEVSER